MVLSREGILVTIQLSADSGLSGYVPNSLRALSFAFNQDVRTVWLKAEVDRELTEDEWDDASEAETMVAADDVFMSGPPLNEHTMTDFTVMVVPPDQPLDPLPDGIVFLRACERVPEGYAGAMPHPRSRAHLMPNLPTEEHGP